MTAEYSANATQTVAAGGSVIFTEAPVPCRCGKIYHRDESGLFRLASPAVMGCSCRPCACFGWPEARYVVSFHANLAIAEGGTVEPISLSVYVDGEEDPSSTMTVTPAAVGDLQNVGAEIVVSVPSICRCSTVSVRNSSGQAVDVSNANLVIEFAGIS